MLVFAFDRDWTVDVNPHPRHEAVPLDWVRHLAHETDHAVYAIGNQDLADEAAIPGVVDIVGRHADDWDDWLGGKQPDGYYERFPTRRERLNLIADLHPDADDYIVVDDLDLSDVDGWAHYHAWEFVPAVERGEIEPSLPWARDPVTDGGLPARAGIVPVDASHLKSFLDEHGDSPGFEVTYTDGDEESTRLCWTISMVTDTPEDGSDTAAVQCTPLPPAGDSVTVPVDAIEMLHTVDLPLEAVIDRAETPADKAAALRRYADADPATVRVSPILTLLEGESVPLSQQGDALHALQSVAAVRPEACTPAIPILRSLLEDPDLLIPATVLETLRVIGEDSPADIAPAVDQITPYLESVRSPARREAAGCLAAVAAEYPDDIVDAVPELKSLLADGADGQAYPVRALERVATESPDAVAPAAGLLAETMLDASLSESVRLGATAALGRVANEDPSLAVEFIDDIVRLYGAEAYKLRNNAVALTFEIAAIHTDLVEPYVDEIAKLLTVDDAYTRTNASGTLARVAGDFPDAVAHLSSTFVDLLSDDDERVRENAAWVLGHVQAPEATSVLEDRLDVEPNEAVRNRIVWALAEIEPA